MSESVLFQMLPSQQAQVPEAVRRGRAPNYGKYGNRPDGTPKGVGYFGEIPNTHDPKTYSTELTAEEEIDGKNLSFPLLVPTLTRKEINLLMDESQSRAPQNKKLIDAIYEKAIEHAVKRMKTGKSPYAEPDELYDLPTE